MDVNSQVKEIKQSFRQMMDGAVAQSMRDKGVDYHLNWGVTLPRLREKADELKQKCNGQGSSFSIYDLAIALWKRKLIRGWPPIKSFFSSVAFISSRGSS